MTRFLVKSVKRFAVVAVTTLAVLCIQTFSQTPSRRIESMKLLTSDAGWAASGGHLYWTSNSGREWSDITPKTGGGQIASVFFLDSFKGWVLLAVRDGSSDNTQFRFDLATTADSGRTWSTERLNMPEGDPSRGFSSTAWLNFADSQHGWALVALNSNAAVSIGVLMKTEDGGSTWSELHGPPIAGPLKFVTSQQGWLAGGPDDELYRSSDGGSSWIKVDLAPPTQAQVGTDAMATYHLPSFISPDRGYLDVAFTDGTKSATVLFSTANGKDWNPYTVLPPEIQGERFIVDHKIISAVAARGKLTLKNMSIGEQGKLIASGGAADVAVKGLGQPSAVRALSFVDDSRGWVLAAVGNCTQSMAQCDHILATSDGGSTWTDVTPPFKAGGRSQIVKQRLTASARHAEYDARVFVSADAERGLCGIECEYSLGIR